MNKIIIVTLFSLGVFASKASAQTSKDSIPVFSIADSASFTGKYKYEGLPFEYMEVSVKDGKLFYSGGEYSGNLIPVKDKKDAFDANGEAVFTFLRNKENKVAELKIDYQGQSYLGKREEKKS
jgi:hypothetical protein